MYQALVQPRAVTALQVPIAPPWAPPQVVRASSVPWEPTVHLLRIYALACVQMAMSVPVAPLRRLVMFIAVLAAILQGVALQ